jgi:hypothetical protein
MQISKGEARGREAAVADQDLVNCVAQAEKVLVRPYGNVRGAMRMSLKGKKVRSRGVAAQYIVRIRPGR